MTGIDDELAQDGRRSRSVRLAPWLLVALVAAIVLTGFLLDLSIVIVWPAAITLTVVGLCVLMFQRSRG